MYVNISIWHLFPNQLETMKKLLITKSSNKLTLNIKLTRLEMAYLLKW